MGKKIMKVNELSKELGITNKDLISFYKDKGEKITSHAQNLSNKQVDMAKAEITVKEVEVEKPATTKADTTPIKEVEPEKPEKVYKMDDMIPCRSVTPHEVIAVGVDKTTTYHWSYYGDVDYLTYKDLQALRRTSYITKPLIVIDDADLCWQWRRELGDTYKYFLGVEYPEEFFELDDVKFRELLETSPDVIKDVLKETAWAMIRNENYPEVRKVKIIDEVLNTCISDFL